MQSGLGTILIDPKISELRNHKDVALRRILVCTVVEVAPVNRLQLRALGLGPLQHTYTALLKTIAL